MKQFVKIRIPLILILFSVCMVQLAKAQETTSKQDTLESIGPIIFNADPIIPPSLQLGSFHHLNNNLLPAVVSIPAIEFETNTTKSSLFNRTKPYIIPIALVSLSLYSMSDASEDSPINKYVLHENVLKNIDMKHRNNLDDYAQYAPLVITAALKIVGVKSKNDLLNSSILVTKSFIASSAISFTLKYSIYTRRPSGNDIESFPSGHTAVAFTTATIMHMEFKDTSPWYSVLGYSFATATGAMRIINNKHWLPDVLTGAAIGIASTHLVYATHKYKWGNKPSNLVIVPCYTGKSLRLNLAYTF